MIAIDTNILVYAHRKDSLFHDRARACVEKQLNKHTRATAFLWPCLHEFISTVTHPKIFRDNPSPLDVAFDQIEKWLKMPGSHLLGETDTHLSTLKKQAIAARLRGPMIHDARIASICLAHGVELLWSADRDFSRFPELKIVNPMN